MANKSQLIDVIHAKVGGDRDDVVKYFNAMIESFSETLINGGEVLIVGFGKFSVTHRAARCGINPSTKEKIHIPANKTIRFSVGKPLKIRL